VPRGGAITFLGAVGMTLLIPLIVCAGLLAVIGVAAGGALGLVRRAAPRAGSADRVDAAAEGRSHDARFAPVVHLELDNAPAEITLRPAA
jgi:hypothetical protein